jgi:hypothetical protein
VTVLQRILKRCFLAAAEWPLLEVDPMTGETKEQLLKNAYAVPKAVLQQATELHGAAQLARAIRDAV